jgi:hypothetical protein
LPFGAAEWMRINLECRGSNPSAPAMQSKGTSHYAEKLAGAKPLEHIVRQNQK